MDCVRCIYYIYDEEYEEYICDCNMDEDDYYNFLSKKECVFFKSNDEYEILRKQI